MAKKRKTRSQKALADSRHVLYHFEETPAQVSPSLVQKPTFSLNLSPNISQVKIQTQTSYAYVLTDIRKTAFITASILVAQIILFFILKRI